MNVKKKEQEHKNRILKYVVLTCVLLVAGISVFAGRYLRLSDKNEDKQSEKSRDVQEDVLTKEAGAVMAQRAQRNNAFEDIPGDSREVIRIVEVIPHDVCSIFPYMIEWGSKEEYDKNTPLGYEGIRYLACKLDRKYFGDKGMFNYTRGGIKEPYLDDYNVQFETGPVDWSENWWRQTKIDENILNANGYFEFVGEGKGLYCIDLDTIVNEDSNNYGIRYKVQAMERNSDAKKGEWEVKDAQYYWAGKKTTESYPTSDITQQTDYNYDLKFSADGTGIREYKVGNVLVGLQANTANNQKYEYAAKTAEGYDWQHGYQYQKNGNYTVNASMAFNVTESTVLEGKYVRIENRQKDDGVLPDAPGYFRLYNAETDGQINVVYQVTFAPAGSGNYILDPAAVQSELNLDVTGDIYKNIIFDFVGGNKGNYDVIFKYVRPDDTTYHGQKYSCNVIKVSDGSGRYALTSTVENAEELYQWVGSGNGDYSKVVTQIDCLGIDYNTDGSAGWRGNGVLPKGVCVGQVSENGDERGSWVFHSVSSDVQNGLTKLNQDGKLAIENNRIYVYSQNRKNRYYERNGFKNNEWFKLLIYMDDPTKTKGLATDAYSSWNMTGQDIVSWYSEELDAFNAKYRIEIIQRTPGELTVDEVNKADLIYIAEEAGLTIYKDNWEKIDAKLGGILEDYPSTLEFTDDFSDEVLLALYDNCLYHEEGKTATTALMLDVPHLRCHCTASTATSNLGKFYYLVDLFDDPAYFSNFIEGYSENAAHSEDGYTTILSNGNVRLYPNKDGNNDTFYNWGRTYVMNTEEEIPPLEEETWKWEYFSIFMSTKYEDGKIVGNGGISLNGAKGSFWGNETIYAHNPPVMDGWTWYAPGSISTTFTDYGNMLNIWKIMHNKTSKKSSSPKVIVTNADYSIIQGNEITDNTYYIYVDEYEALEAGAFLIKYRVDWTPIEVTNPTELSSLSITRLSDGKEVKNDTSPEYNKEPPYEYDASEDFKNAEGQLNGVKSVGYQITAQDKANKADSAIVWIIVRDSFMLN